MSTWKFSSSEFFAHFLRKSEFRPFFELPAAVFEVPPSSRQTRLPELRQIHRAAPGKSQTADRKLEDSPDPTDKRQTAPEPSSPALRKNPKPSDLQFQPHFRKSPLRAQPPDSKPPPAAHNRSH